MCSSLYKRDGDSTCLRSEPESLALNVRTEISQGRNRATFHRSEVNVVRSTWGRQQLKNNPLTFISELKVHYVATVHGRVTVTAKSLIDLCAFVCYKNV